MEILLDTSIYLAVCLNEASKPRIVELTSGATLVSPKSVHWEMGNALSGMIKKGRLSLLQAKACIAAYERIPVRFVDIELGATLQLAYTHRMWAYDGYVLQSALSLSLPLLTLDKPQSKIAEKVGVQLFERLA